MEDVPLLTGDDRVEVEQMLIASVAVSFLHEALPSFLGDLQSVAELGLSPVRHASLFVHCAHVGNRSDSFLEILLILVSGCIC